MINKVVGGKDGNVCFCFVIRVVEYTNGRW